jgi:hypothetical protein
MVRLLPVLATALCAEEAAAAPRLAMGRRHDRQAQFLA